MQYSVVKFSEVIKNGWRFDAEYWQPKYLRAEELVKNQQWHILNDISNVKGGKRLPLNCSFSDYGIPYIRAEDIKPRT